MTIPDQVIRDPSIKDRDVYRVIIDGKLVPAEWTQYGAAQAGLAVERRRADARKAKGDAA